MARLISSRGLTTGRPSDWLTVRLARRNNGVMEAESKLWPATIFIIIVPSALILWGVGAANQIHWFGLAFAMVMLAYVNSVGTQVSINYLIDAYPGVAGDTMTTLIIIRNTLAFAFGYV